MAVPQFVIADIIKLVQDEWHQETSETISGDIVKKFLVSAVRHVETLDYPKSNEYTVDGSNNITFTTTPSNTSMILYGYRCLSSLQRASINGELLDNELGVSWKSGMDSISTATTGKIKNDLRTDFKKQYEDALFKAKISGHTPIMIDLYEE